MNRCLVLAFFLFFGFQASQADNLTPVKTPSAVAASTTPSAVSTLVAKKKRKKKKSPVTAASTVQPTPSSSSTPVPTPKASMVPTPQAKVSAAPTPAPVVSAVPDASLTAGDQAYTAKDYAKALAAYQDYLAKTKKTPELEKKILLAKFYAGKAMEEDARKGIKDEGNYIKGDGETSNLSDYGKKEPTRGSHLVTISLAVLTPQLAGGDIGFTFLSHFNVGMGIGFMGIDPRIKYYLDGDNGSFFIGAGFATYNFTASGSFGDSSGGGSGTITVNGTFAHFTFGPSFQGQGGFFMELPIDVGLANFSYSGIGNVSGGSGGGSGSSGGSSSGTYNGPFGMIGFRFGFSI